MTTAAGKRRARPGKTSRPVKAERSREEGSRDAQSAGQEADLFAGEEIASDRRGQSESVEFLRSVLKAQDAEISQKIQAAKALDAIMARGATGQSAEDIATMTAAEIDAEIARTKAMLDA